MGTTAEVAAPTGVLTPVAQAEANQDALVRMLREQSAGIDVPAAEIAEHVRVLAYRVRLVEQIQATSPGLVSRQMGPGFSRNTLLTIMCGSARPSTIAYFIARMNALGWAP